MLKKNMLIPLEITDVTHDGNGVGRHDGLAVFVPESAVGDKLTVRVVKRAKNLAYGIIETILEPSPDRIQNDCPVYRRCGGCSLRHISYESEMRVKEKWLTDNLTRIVGVHLPLEAPLASPHESRYRNKAQYPVRRIDGKIRTGFFARRSHDLVPVGDCLLQPAFFRDISGAFCEFLEEFGIEPYEEASHTGLVRHLYIRLAPGTGEVLVCVVINGSDLPHSDILMERLRAVCPALKTLVLNSNRNRTNVITGDREKVLFGDGTITDVLNGVKIRISSLSFHQVNHASTQILYRKAAEYAAPKPDETILDLYCGTGAIGLSMASRAGRIVGVEVVEDAVRDAVQNASLNGIGNARFLCSDAFGAVTALREESLAPDTVILDPPRKGLGKDVVANVAAMSPRKIVYISCNSATLARDLVDFREHGYQAVRACCLDLFPRTAHAETVVLLSRKMPNDVIHVDLELDELDVTAAEAKATYQEIKDYVLDKYGFKVSQLYIAQVKRKHGIIERENYNKPKSEDAKVPQCPPEKETAILDALRQFGMIGA